MFCSETLLVYLEGCSEKIGGLTKPLRSMTATSVGENIIGDTKGQWVFGGIERESGRTFFVPVWDRTADTLTNVIRAWIEPGTTLISDCWVAYQDIASRGSTHRTVNRSISFVNPDTGDHTNTIEGM
jgi:hypothetical protein